MRMQGVSGRSLRHRTKKIKIFFKNLHEFPVAIDEALIPPYEPNTSGIDEQCRYH